ncbi:MAG: arsenate reductase ArsC [Alphaproteobacteria bacterium]|nr:arsenate reductase ArsC [Alphaproteobacteria bacterium]MDE2630529.1 arsenate reductase ArsC [Alphaproteobacteria bacterium]
MTLERTYNVLFLCTGNSARSILAEAFLNAEGQGRFRAFSAGSFPKGAVNPFALALLKQIGFPTDGLRSKSWDEFAVAGAPKMDFVFTVCDRAAGEVCPVWPGQPVTAHWGIPDPAAAEGSDAEKMQAFREALRQLSNRIGVFTELPFDKLDRIKLKARLDDIGRAAD